MKHRFISSAVLFVLVMVFVSGLCVCQAASQPEASADTDDAQIAYLYIGAGESYSPIQMAYTGALTPELLIEAIATETGWNLELYEPVTVGKGGMTVCFSRNAAIFTGVPAQQKDEYHVFDLQDFVASVLDSITTTLQNNFVDVELGGDPSSLDVYYCVEENQPISIDEISFYLPIDTPYTSIHDFIS